MYQNEQRKREFLEHLKGAKGFAESSLNSIAEAIDQWQTFSENEDFSKFNKSSALAFRDWLKSRKANTETGTISLTTQDNYLRRIKKFFKWLSDQPGYKSKVLKNDVEFLRLSRGDARIARQRTTKPMPTLEEAKTIIESIEIKNEIDRRDRAVICFTLITGMRVSAVASLRMKSVDMKKELIDQNPADGVKIKNSKRILTTFFPIGWDKPERYFIAWYEHLKSKGFQPNDPVFPVTMNSLNAEKREYSKEFVGRDFWSDAGGVRKIFKKRCENANTQHFTPHSFRHLVVSTLGKENQLTEEQKRAISLTLGHARVGTTFGSYGYGSMTAEKAVEIVQELKNHQNDKESFILSEEERIVLRRVMERML